MVKRVRALERGLDLLHALNAQDGADISVLAEATNLSRATAYRMMETLITRDLVHKRGGAGRYWLTQKVRKLSAGLDDDSSMIQSAVPLLDELCEHTQWPVSLTTPLGIQMVVRAHTDLLTPLVLVKIPIGHTVSMINSAGGLAYLAHCTDEQLSLMLDLILKAPATDAFEESLRDQSVLRTIVTETRARGYSYRVTDDTYAAMGCPVLIHGRPVASLSVRYFTSAVSQTEAVDRHLIPTQKVADAIAGVWQARRGPPAQQVHVS